MSSYALSKLILEHANALKVITSTFSCRCNSTKSSVQMAGLAKAASRKEKISRRKPRSNIQSLSRADLIDPNTTDWSSVYDAAQSYNPSVIPLPIRMGRPRASKLGDIPLKDSGNVELLKIPNFFHLTPPAIKKHCESLKEFCTPWPQLDPANRVIRVTSVNFLYSGPSIRHPESRKIKLQVYLKDLDLDAHARQKMILLSGHRYNPANDELTILTDRCPTRKQNKEYAYYLLAALYHEAWKTEDWEVEKGDKTNEELQVEIEKINMELNPSFRELKSNVKKRRLYCVVNDKVIRFNKHGHPFVYEMQQKDGGYNTRKGLNSQEKIEAKQKWDIICKNIEQYETFDPIYRRNSESEFKN